QAGRPADARGGRTAGRQHRPRRRLTRMYSLVSTPVLGFDLTRLGGGAATAEVLLRALCLGEGDLPVLARRLPGQDVRGPLWLRGRPATPPIDLGPHHHAVTALLDRVRTVSSHEVHRLLRAGDDSRRAPSGWATAVHSASWAGYLSGRTRTAAAAQLLLVQAV